MILNRVAPKTNVCIPIVAISMILVETEIIEHVITNRETSFPAILIVLRQHTFRITRIKPIVCEHVLYP